MCVASMHDAADGGGERDLEREPDRLAVGAACTPASTGVCSATGSRIGAARARRGRCPGPGTPVDGRQLAERALELLDRGRHLELEVGCAGPGWVGGLGARRTAGPAAAARRARVRSASHVPRARAPMRGRAHAGQRPHARRAGRAGARPSPGAGRRAMQRDLLGVALPQPAASGLGVLQQVELAPSRR